MKIDRTKNATRNIVFGMALKIYQIIIPFIMRTILLYVLGIKYLGLNSLFSSILQVLNLAELGVGTAMVYSMYKPIAEDDTDTICALMRLYRLYYRVIGLVIAVIGVCLIPFLSKLVKMDTVPDDINIYILYIMNLSATVFSYWLFAYKNCILNAYQRNDIVSKITLIINTVQYLCQTVVILTTHNYYLYTVVILTTQIITNIITALIVNRLYPMYKPSKRIDKEIMHGINKKIRDLFTAKIGAVIVNSVDTVVISAFLGLKVLAIYQNYFFILTSVVGMISTIFNACVAGIGNSIIVETQEKNLRDLKKLTFIITWIAGVCSCCFLCLYQPFMTLWVGKENMFGMGVVICLTIYFYIYEINQLLNMYKDAAGIWHEDRFRPLATAAANLCMNLIMVNFWGIYGIIFSTVLSTLIVGMPWLLHNLFTVLFDGSMLMAYLKKIIMYTLLSTIAAVVCGIICSLINLPEVLTVIVNLFICIAVPNAIFITAYRKTDEFGESIALLNTITKGRIKLLGKICSKEV